MHKKYIGDGAYVDYDGYHLVLTTENGISIQNTVCLEPMVWESLKRYVEALEAEQAQESRQAYERQQGEEERSYQED